MGDLTRTTDTGGPALESRRSAARWPWVLVVLFGVMAISGSFLVAANGESLVGQGSYLLAFGMFAVVGALIVSRDRRNVIGLMLLGAAVITASSFVSGELTTWLVADGRTGPLAVSVGLLNNFGWLFGILPVVFFLPLLFPDGRLPSRRWRAYVWFVGVFLAVALFTLVFGQETLTGSGELGVANPFYVEAIGRLPALDPLVAILLPGLFGLTVYSLFSRFRRSTGVERQQFKWVAFGFLTALVLIIVITPIQDPTVNGLIGGLAFLAFPVSIGISVLRFHLYDLDVVVKKTVVYAALALFATIVYLALVLGLGSWLGRGSSFLTMLAAVVVAVTFQPARARLTRFANRLVYGARATPYEVLSAFSERVGDAYGETDVLPRMARVLGEGVGAERSDVWLMVGQELRQVAVWPAGGDVRPAVAALDGIPSLEGMDRTYAVEHAGEVLGALAIRKPVSDPITPSDEKLIAGLASQAGLVLANVRLTEELKARLDDLAAAQRRLVAAQDEERRKIERNIHDGAQQQLVALAVQLRLAQTMLGRDPAKVADLLETLHGQTNEALEDLRDLARGIYPPLLADKGLAAALAAQARKSTVPVALEVDQALPRFTREVESAVYFSMLEAMQNVAKYAEASEIVVRVSTSDRELTFSVTDDGRGFDTSSVGYGTGLQGIADRLGAADGILRVVSAPGNGTTLSGRLPLTRESV